MKKIFILMLLVAMVLMVGCEGTQKAIYDKKADIVGTNRTATAYHPVTGEALGEWTDDSMRFERVDTRSISIWLGDVNKKVFVANAPVIIEDN